MNKLNINNFYRRTNMGDCTVRYIDKDAYNRALEQAKPKRIPKGKKLMRDPFVGYVLTDK